MKINGVIMQYFHRYINHDMKLWQKLKADAKHLQEIGITAIWMPPAYKGAGGINDTGYGVYDMYDLGEFNQKGAIETKYGSKADYLSCIETIQNSSSVSKTAPKAGSSNISNCICFNSKKTKSASVALYSSGV